MKHKWPAGEAGKFAVVHDVSNYWVAYAFHVHANLVGAAGEDANFDQCCAWELERNLVVAFAVFALAKRI